MTDKTEQEMNCSFCMKSANEVKKLIAGPNVYICDECVDLCYDILKGNTPIDPESGEITPKKKPLEIKEIPYPSKIKEFLDDYVIGQEDAKDVVSVAVYNHYKRLENPVIDDVEIDKSNILMLGPTGSGKTLIAQTISRLLEVPFAVCDATSITEAGYVGDDVESIITRLLQTANWDVKKAERGIIYIDEIDKKARRSGSSGASRDVSGEGVQQALLKILEGSDVFVPQGGSKKGPQTEMVKVNTKNILFIVGGAFVGLEDIILKDHQKGSSIGFGATIRDNKEIDKTKLLLEAEPEHLVKFGLIPELIGRLPVHAVLKELNEKQLITILTEPKNAVVKQFQKMFKVDDVELFFEEEALLAVAKRAIDHKTGARGLRSVLEKRLTKLQFNLPDLRDEGVMKIIIKENVITGDSEPELIYKQNEA